MKKLFYIGVAVFAFVIGFFAFYVRPLLMPIPFSELEENLSLYKSREINVKGQFFIIKWGDTPNFYRLKDSNHDCPGSIDYCESEAILELSQEVEKKEITLIKELNEKNYQYLLEKGDYTQGRYVVEAEITGYVEERESGFSSIRSAYIIKVKEIKQTSPIKFMSTRK